VEVIRPRSVTGVAAALAWAHHARIVQPALGDHERVLARPMNPPGDRLDDVLCARVEDRVDRVESQPVDAEVTDPALCALQHPFADRVALPVVEVDGPAPGRLV